MSPDVTEEEETVTFHDALSDTSDDILLEDLEYDRYIELRHCNYLYNYITIYTR